LSGALRLAFAGTPEFAVPALQALASKHSLVAVYTQPDRPSGRGRQLTASPVKKAAQELDLPVRQPLTLKDPDSQALVAAEKVDLLIVVAYGLILPQAVLELPRLGCINIHASLLPRWRGAAPIQRAILAGDRETGISIMQMEAGLDTGPVLLERSTPIGAQETAGELEARLAMLGADCVVEAVELMLAGRTAPRVQAGDGITYARKLEKSEARIDWSLPATRIAAAVRAFNPRPVAETRWRGEQLRIWRARAADSSSAAQPGEVIEAGAGQLVVKCGEGALAIEELQLPGKQSIATREFLAAHDLRGAVLSSVGP